MDGEAIDAGMVASGVPLRARAGWDAVMALDRTLGQVVRTTREPLVGQMRLTWWHGALTALDAAPPPAEPVLAALAADVMPLGVTGAALAGQVNGWEVLLDGPVLDEAMLAAFAAARGGGVFAALAMVLGGGSAQVGPAAEGWALVDLADQLSHADSAARARAMAAERFVAAFAVRWPRVLRPLGTLAVVARADLTRVPPPGSPARAWRLIRHRLTGR